MPDHANLISIENKAMLPQFTSKTRATNYSQDGKCVGMLSPELSQNFNRAFHSARGSGQHTQISPTPNDAASILVGLLMHRQKCISQTNKTLSQKVKDSYQRALPIHIHEALQKWAMVSRPKFVIDLAPFFWLTVGSWKVFDLTFPLVP